MGQPTSAYTGNMRRTYSYTPFGMPTGRKAGSIQYYSYDFDPQRGNLLSRTDSTRNLTETFGYDPLNRLSSMDSRQISYANNGNITQMPGVGTIEYGNSGKPYRFLYYTV